MDITGRFIFPSPWGITRLPATATGGEDGTTVPQIIEALRDDGALRTSELITLANSVLQNYQVKPYSTVHLQLQVFQQVF
ncbi:hypothetical protein BOTNAR_0431g00130 [Botryotinia narcissicola]|uniref:Uncharacterized protein n=1 Tax=Botryotinia narcissicola TaxID=278944 RepID=A0A4Z1HKR1_9HELO|nr:hypothetical protein BOTNAR_0431g00130 [Botryotinia narcissicola]